jgi:hypothetical protein
MNSNSFTTTITVDQTPEQAFAAINNVRAWWSESIEGPTDTLGGEFIFKYENIHSSTQRITELVPGKKVVWAVTDSALQFADPKDEWTGTKIVFDIARKAKKTEVRFTHVGLVPDLACYGACSKGWTQCIQDCLQGFIATSEKQPALKRAGRTAERRA